MIERSIKPIELSLSLEQSNYQVCNTRNKWLRRRVIRYYEKMGVRGPSIRSSFAICCKAKVNCFGMRKFETILTFNMFICIFNFGSDIVGFIKQR